MENNSGISQIVVILAVVLAIGIGWAVYFYYKNTEQAQDYLKQDSILEQGNSIRDFDISAITESEYLMYSELHEGVEQENNSYNCDLDNHYDRRRCIEAHILPAYAGKIKRVNDKCFEINLLNNSIKELCEKEFVDWRDTSGYGLSFSDYINDLGFIFNKHYYEGINKLLVSEANGREAEIWADPVFSPNNKRFITASTTWSEGSGFAEDHGIDGFQIWSIKKDGRFSIDIESLTIKDGEFRFGIIDPIWIDNRNIVFIKGIYECDSTCETRKEYAKLHLITNPN